MNENNKYDIGETYRIAECLIEKKKVKDALNKVLFVCIDDESYSDDALREKCYWKLINELGLNDE